MTAARGSSESNGVGTRRPRPHGNLGARFRVDVLSWWLTTNQTMGLRCRCPLLRQPLQLHRSPWSCHHRRLPLRCLRITTPATICLAKRVLSVASGPMGDGCIPREVRSCVCFMLNHSRPQSWHRFTSSLCGILLPLRGVTSPQPLPSFRLRTFPPFWTSHMTGPNYHGGGWQPQANIVSKTLVKQRKDAPPSQIVNRAGYRFRTQPGPGYVVMAIGLINCSL